VAAHGPASNEEERNDSGQLGRSDSQGPRQARVSTGSGDDLCCNFLTILDNFSKKFGTVPVLISQVIRRNEL
jgi:hypothetical protein